MTTYHLISASQNDGVEGVDIALLDGLGCLQDATVQAWMADQGYSPEEPSEVMLMTSDGPVPEFECLPVSLTDAEVAMFSTVTAGQKMMDAAGRSPEDALADAAWKWAETHTAYDAAGWGINITGVPEAQEPSDSPDGK